MLYPIDHVILTAGLNELPVLVCAHRLCCVNFDQGKPLPRFSVLRSPENRTSVRLVKRTLLGKLKKDSIIDDDSQLRWDETEVDAHDPAQISEHVRRIINNDISRSSLGPRYRYHLNYTGGTAAMAAQSIEALRDLKRDYDYDASYLASSDHVIRDSQNRVFAGLDERRYWDLTFPEVAALHGYMCQSEPLDENLIEIGVEMLPVVIRNQKLYENQMKLIDWDCKERKGWMKWNDWPKNPPNSYEPVSGLIPWPALGGDPAWTAVTRKIQQAFVPSAWTYQNGAWQINAKTLQQGGKFAGLRQVRLNQCLELVTYRALRDATSNAFPNGPVDLRLGTICWPSTEQKYKTKFELDVAGVFGYELLMVSCSLTSFLPSIKEKGMEAVIRSRAIGGSGARTIIVSQLRDDYIPGVQANLRDDLGGTDKNVVLFSYSSEEDLRIKFEEFLEKQMNWRAKA